MAHPIAKAFVKGLWLGLGAASFIGCFLLIFIGATGGF